MHFDQRFQDEGIQNDVPITHDALVQTDVVDEIFGSPEVEFEKVFKDVKIDNPKHFIKGSTMTPQQTDV